MGSRIKLGEELLFPSQYLAAGDCQDAGGELTFTISKIAKEELQLKSGGKTNKGVIYFKETDKKFVVNVTNGTSIASMYGDLAQDWVGKRVTLYATQCQVGREMKDCIRVRERKAAPAEPGAPPPPPPTPSKLSPELQAVKDEWAKKMEADPNLEQFNAMIAELPKDGDARKIAWNVMDKHAKEFGIVFDRKTNLFKPNE